MSEAYLAAKNNLIRCRENTFYSLLFFLLPHIAGNNRYPWPVAGKSPNPNKHISHSLLVLVVQTPLDPRKESET